MECKRSKRDILEAVVKIEEQLTGKQCRHEKYKYQEKEDCEIQDIGSSISVHKPSGGSHRHARRMRIR